MKKIRTYNPHKPDKSFMLLDLTTNNPWYERRLAEYNSKIGTVSLFKNEEEFIKEEIQRISNLFIKTVEAFTDKDNIRRTGINYMDFVGYAYTWLNMGQNWPVHQIVDNARGSYTVNPLLLNEPDFSKAVFDNLQDGVAWLMYEKFLKQKLMQPKKGATPKNFETEIRAAPKEKYLKIFLREGINFEAVKEHIKGLPSVRNANITTNKKTDLTVYVAKAYSIEETQEEVELTLQNYFEGKDSDPIIIDENLSAISNKAYDQIIDKMLLFGKNLETSKRLNQLGSEEWYRDYFIPYLNSISPTHTAKGEVYNSTGKTDILITDTDGNNIFIAECKLWKGESELTKAVEQLLSRYVNWRDEKLALVVFNKGAKNFSAIINTAVDTLKNHPLFDSFVGHRKDSSYSFIFHHPDDPAKKIKLELMLFNVN